MTVLVLAGTSEARAVLEYLQGQDVIASLAGVTRAPAGLPVPTRVGGFGGAEGLHRYVTEQNICGLIDATHPFAAKMTQTAAKVCADLKLPHVILQRPKWEPVAGDDWHFVDAISEIPMLIPKGAAVFLGTGRQTLSEFACLEGRRLLARVIDPPITPFPFENGEFLVGKPPFPMAEEIALFQEKYVDWLVVKNAGGQKSRTKLDAARALRIPVVMINRPALPRAKVVETVAETLKWIRGQGWLNGS